MSESKRHRVVIVGGGFGALSGSSPPGVGAFGVAGLSCSAFLPLAISFSERQEMT
jgi:hypothetical protein